MLACIQYSMYGYYTQEGMLADILWLMLICLYYFFRHEVELHQASLRTDDVSRASSRLSATL